jgi:hypothetical protein
MADNCYDKWGRVRTPPPTEKTRPAKKAPPAARRTSFTHYKFSSYPGKTPELSCHIIGERRRSDR